jgi:hypothetical protein
MTPELNKLGIVALVASLIFILFTASHKETRCIKQTCFAERVTR